MGQLSCGIAISGVFEKDGRYYRVTKVRDGERVKSKWTALSRIDEGRQALLRALYELDPACPDSIRGLIAAYRAGGMDELKPATRHDYERILLRLDHYFGSMPLGTLRPSHIAQWLERRRQEGRGAVRANREFAVLSAIHKFGMRAGWVEMNPCHGVPRNRERPKRGIVTDEAFLAIFEAAAEPFQDLIAAAFLSGVRQTDLLAWTKSANLRPEGITYRQSKTGKPHTVEWSSALGFFVRRACDRHPDSDLVFLNIRRTPWTAYGINSQMRRLWAKTGVRWCFKDLRAKAQTDSPHSVLGHGAALEAVYRKALRTKPVR